MAQETNVKNLKLLVLSKYETVELISLLSAQLGKTHINRHCTGDTPSLSVSDERGTYLYRLAISVE